MTPAGVEETVRAFRVPIHIDPADDGWWYRSVSMSPEEAAQSLRGAFRDLRGFDPPAGPWIVEKAKDALWRAASESLGFVVTNTVGMGFYPPSIIRSPR